MFFFYDRRKLFEVSGNQKVVEKSVLVLIFVGIFKLVKLELIVSEKRMLSIIDFIENDTKRVNIRFVRRRLTPILLRSIEISCSSSSTSFSRYDFERESEISNFENAIFNEDIFRFQILMHHSIGPNIWISIDQITHDE